MFGFGKYVDEKRQTVTGFGRAKEKMIRVIDHLLTECHVTAINTVELTSRTAGTLLLEVFSIQHQNVLYCNCVNYSITLC